MRVTVNFSILGGATGYYVVPTFRKVGTTGTMVKTAIVLSLAHGQLGCLRTCMGKYGLGKKAGGGRVRCGNASCWAAPNQRREFHPFCVQQWEGSSAMQRALKKDGSWWCPSCRAARDIGAQFALMDAKEKKRKRKEPAQEQEKKDNLKCPFCPCEGRPKEFFASDRSNLNQHLMSVHHCDIKGDPAPCPCRHCGMDCGSQNKRRTHEKKCSAAPAAAPVSDD